jgi:SAM-dependent methyltransferase
MKQSIKRKDISPLSSGSRVDESRFLVGRDSSDKRLKLTTSKTEVDALVVQFEARSNKITVEENNRTNTTRTIEKYEEVLKVQFAPFINWHYNNYGPINVLDAGCGNAVFSKELLSSRARSKIKKIYGVSLDNFPGALALSEAQCKFSFMHMPIDVATHRLIGLGVKINVIFDVWGPFSYSLQKMNLLRQYYSILQKGGRAFLFLGACFTHEGNVSAMPKISFKNHDGSETWPEDVLVGLNKRYPEHFKSNPKCERVLIMCKNDDQFPFDYEFEHSCAPMLGFSFCAKEVSRRDMLQGNAAMPAEITIRPKLKGR